MYEMFFVLLLRGKFVLGAFVCRGYLTLSPSHSPLAIKTRPTCLLNTFLSATQKDPDQTCVSFNEQRAQYQIFQFCYVSHY